MPGEKGEPRIRGEKGDTPAHEWQGTSLRFENPDGSWGNFVNLQGPLGILLFRSMGMNCTQRITESRGESQTNGKNGCRQEGYHA